MDEDRYYESKLSEYMEKAKVPFEDYIELEEKYDELLKVVRCCIEENNFEDLKEYMEGKF